MVYWPWCSWCSDLCLSVLLYVSLFISVFLSSFSLSVYLSSSLLLLFLCLSVPVCLCISPSPWLWMSVSACWSRFLSLYISLPTWASQYSYTYLSLYTLYSPCLCFQLCPCVCISLASSLSPPCFHIYVPLSFFSIHSCLFCRIESRTASKAFFPFIPIHKDTNPFSKNQRFSSTSHSFKTFLIASQCIYIFSLELFLTHACINI